MPVAQSYKTFIYDVLTNVCTRGIQRQIDLYKTVNQYQGFSMDNFEKNIFNKSCGKIERLPTED